MERFERSVAVLQGWAQEKVDITGDELEPFQPGFSDDEIADLEDSQGAPFAPEVKEFLRHWNRVEGAGGIIFYGAHCWVEAELAASGPWLMLGDYWRYADGDQLVMPLSGEKNKVFLYLHEHGPNIEEFAPSFSLALWRTAREKL